MNPIPHGMRTGFRLTKDDRQVYKVLDLFYVLSVEHWADLDKVISELLKVDKSLHGDPKTVKGILQKSLWLAKSEKTVTHCAPFIISWSPTTNPRISPWPSQSFGPKSNSCYKKKCAHLVLV